ncbi:hypothetical protein EYF80_041866 [Liparis tanakae]|uniref:Uncharacterized protein n=1 Tax=Liparis tanakae TaxID=230148 RepID=A0A4Z2G4V9_9TELE|nr:hypothetical protein EYF80_041866 [Liparis tanakae]
MVKMKKMRPSAAIANRFFPMESHWRGFRVCFVPGGAEPQEATGGLCTSSTNSSSTKVAMLPLIPMKRLMEVNTT